MNTIETAEVADALSLILDDLHDVDLGYVGAGVDSESEDVVVLETERGNFLLTVTALED